MTTTSASRFLSQGGADAKLWVPGEIVTKWEYRKSDLDGETYQRKTATGGGATDPADDTANYAAKSYTRIAALPATAIGPVAIAATASIYFARGATKPAMPAIATGVRTQVLSLTGRGALLFLGMYKGAASNARVEIFADGRSVFNEVIPYTGASNECAIFLGGAASGKAFGSDVLMNTVVPDPIGLVFRRTAQVFVTPVTGTFITDDFLAYQMRSEA